VGNDLKQPEKGVWTLKANQCPSVIVEPGFLSTQTDIDYLVKQENQQNIAKNILNGIETYAQRNLLSKEDNIRAIQDTILRGAAYIDTKNRIWLSADKIIHSAAPNKTLVDVTKAVLVINDKIEDNDILRNKLVVSRRIIIHSAEGKMLRKYGEAAKNGVFVFEDAVILNKPPYYPNESAIKKYNKATGEEIEAEKKQLTYINNTILEFYNGKKIKRAYASNKLDKALIFYEDGTADTVSIKQGEKIRLIPPPPPPPPNKVIKNTTDNEIGLTNLKTDSDYKKFDKVFTKVENEAGFKGGEGAWLKYIQSILQQNADLLMKDNNQGTCLVQFIVGTSGNVSDVKATTMENTRLAEIAVRAIAKGPKWEPAMQNGHLVVSYRQQSVTFKPADNLVDNSEPK
ncbi:MAG: energy transducer TonB, partial [Ginsengibacter sp.]